MQPRSSTLRIDRAVFVSLTFAMAGLACNTGTAASVAVVEIPRQPPQPADAGALSSKDRDDDPGKLRAAAPTAADDAEDDDVLTEPSAEGSGTTARGQGCGWVDPSTVRRTAGVCNDDRCKVGTCS